MLLLPPIVAIAATFLMQTAAREPVRPGTIAGTVISDQSGSPLRRARVTLLPRATGLVESTVETDDDGNFLMENVTPGPYGLQATRDGYLASTTPRSAQFRLPRIIRIMPGDKLKSVTFRLQPWAVIDGTVRFFDDREPAMGIPVFAYQKIYYRGQKTYVPVGRTRTDDRGYYRLPGLRPGPYLLAAIYNKPIAKIDKTEAIEIEKVPEREASYASAFFPSGSKITDAVPVHINAGQNLSGYDLYLQKSETVRIAGRVIDDCTGEIAPSATLDVVQVDEDGASVPTNAEIALTKGGWFLIRGLTPGEYEVRSSLPAMKPCPVRVERKRLIVTGPIGQLDLLLSRSLTTYFELRRDGRAVNDTGLDVQLEPKSTAAPMERFTIGQSPTARRPRTEVTLQVHEEYGIFFTNLPSEDDYQAPPFTVRAGGIADLFIRSNGGRVTGNILDDQQKPLPGAVVTFIPETYQPQHFREGYSDQSGAYTVTGLAPGSYTAVAWLDAPPCDFFNPNAKLECSTKGKSVTVSASGKSSLDLQLINVEN